MTTAIETALIEADGVGVRLAGRDVLHQVSLSVCPGEVVSVMGPSGSGKSTLLHCLAGILRPDSGEVRLAGQPLSRYKESQRSRIRLREMGFVLQFGDLIPELTLLENVRLPLQLLGASATEATRRARNALAELGIDQVASSRPVDVSGGEAQRAAVARAIVHRPRVVFADEPTGALDTMSGEAVMEALTSLVRSAGTALVIVTHDTRVASYAARNVTLQDGRIISADLASA